MQEKKPLKKHWFILLLSICLPFLSDGQNPTPTNLTDQPIFHRLTNKDGLSQGTINCILQDRLGFMWFGTMDGLNRYDGYEITVFRNLPGDTNSISSNVVNQIIEDNEGLLWIITDKGLNVYNPVLNAFRRVRLNTINKTDSEAKINCATIDHSGQLWFGTEDQGIICYSPNSLEQKHYLSTPDKPDGLISNSIKTLFADSRDNLWIGFQLGGMATLDASTGHFTNYYDIPAINYPSANLSINIFAETKDHKILIGAHDLSLITYDPELKIFYRTNLPNNKIKSDVLTIRTFEGSKTDQLWIGTDDIGLISLNSKNGDYSIYTQGNSENSLVYNTINSLYIDRDNNLWIGTYGKGINILSHYLKAFYSFTESNSNMMGLSFSSVRSIFEDEDGIIWTGGYNDFNKIDLKSGRTTVRENMVAYSICQDPSDKNLLWVGTEGTGLFKYKKNTGEFFKFPVSLTTNENTVVGCGVFEITADNNGFIYFGTEFGLNILDTKTGKFRFFGNVPSDTTSIVPGQIMAIFNDTKNVIWVGSISGGLARFNKSKNTFTRFAETDGNQESLIGNRINCIYEDAKNRFWIGTNMGLNLMNRESGTFKLYTEADGLPNNFVYGILDDKNGYLWLSTNKGISEFDPDNEIFINFDKADGLPGNEFNTAAFFKKNNQRLYFGGVDGLVAFNPDKIIKNPIPPKVVFTKISKSNNEFVNDTVISYLNQIILQPDDVIVNFEFSALNYINASNCRYAYMIGNLHEQRIDLGHKRSLMLANLNPGEYYLKVKASNNDGLWNETPATLKIVVLPWFYETVWFKLLIIFALLGVMITVFVFRIKLIRKQKELLQSLVEVKTRELKDAIEDLADEVEERKKTADELREANTTKDKFFSIIAHDLKSPFNTLLGFSDLLVEQWAEFDDSEKLEFVKRIKSTSENTYKLVTNLLEWSRLQKGSIDFNPVKTNIRYLADISITHLKHDAELKEIQFQIDIPGFINAFADQNMVNFVFRNLISNAIKFTPRHGLILIGAKSHENRIICKVEDNGVGLSREAMDNIFKLENTISTKGTEGETGTGLGLILCKEFVKKNRGSIWVESTPEKGSKFFFSLPVSEHF